MAFELSKDDATRPPVAIGHVSIAVSDIAAAGAFFGKLGMRPIAEGEEVAVLELRGGTHLVAHPAKAPIKAGTPAPFDLMVDDIDAAHAYVSGLATGTSSIEESRFHRYFRVDGPDGYRITITSSHAGDRAV